MVQGLGFRVSKHLGPFLADAGPIGPIFEDAAVLLPFHALGVYCVQSLVSRAAKYRRACDNTEAAMIRHFPKPPKTVPNRQQTANSAFLAHAPAVKGYFLLTHGLLAAATLSSCIPPDSC